MPIGRSALAAMMRVYAELMPIFTISPAYHDTRATLMRAYDYDLRRCLITCLPLADYHLRHD